MVTGESARVMAEQKNRWNWEVTGFEPRKTFDQEDRKVSSPLVRRYSISTSSALQHSEQSKQALASKFQKLKDKVKVWIWHTFHYYWELLLEF